MSEYDIKIDKELNIITEGIDDIISNTINYPYEPTPYKVLERLSKYINEDDVVLDYGCGKGRVEFYLSTYSKCKVIGLDYDDRMIRDALINKGDKDLNISFINENAINYKLDKSINNIYFFNPFSLKILYSVLDNILESYYSYPRDITLYFYYPSSSYLLELLKYKELEFYDEIGCYDLFEKYDDRETIMIFKLYK